MARLSASPFDTDFDQLKLLSLRPSNSGRDECGNVHRIVGDVVDDAVLNQAIDERTVGVVYLAGVPARAIQHDQFAARNSLVTGLEKTLTRLSKIGRDRFIIFASSVAVYGDRTTELLSEQASCQPTNDYGSLKLDAEKILQKQFVAGACRSLSVRLPGVVARSTVRLHSQSDFVSELLRRAAIGESVICPVSKDTLLWISSAKMVAINLAHTIRILRRGALDGSVLNFPGTQISVGQLLNATCALFGQKCLSQIEWKQDDMIQTAMDNRPTTIDIQKALQLGLKGDMTTEGLVLNALE